MSNTYVLDSVVIELFRFEDIKLLDGKWGFDAVSNKGLLGLIGPTGILVKSRATPEVLEEFFKWRIVGQRKDGIKSGVLVVREKPSNSFDEYFHNRCSKIRGFKIEILTVSEIIEKLSNRTKEKFRITPEEIVEQKTLTDLRIELATTPPTEEESWEETRERYISEVHDILSEGNLVLFLGTGVGAYSHIPNWKSLLTQLRFRLIQRKLNERGINTNEDDCTALAEEFPGKLGLDPLLSAQYIRRGLRNTFIDDIVDILYDDLQDQNPTLQAIGTLCSAGNLKAIITHNYDDLVERQLMNHNIDAKPILQGGLHTNNSLPIYHVHGFLPQHLEAYDISEYSDVILSEESYHQLYQDPYNWVNLVQHEHLMHHSCLIIGHSLTDPNLRRLLYDAAHREGSSWHYAIFTRETPKNTVNEPRPPHGIEVDYLKIHHRLEEAAFRDLHIKIIWIEDYPDIPTILERIRIG